MECFDELELCSDTMKVVAVPDGVWNVSSINKPYFKFNVLLSPMGYGMFRKTAQKIMTQFGYSAVFTVIYDNNHCKYLIFRCEPAGKHPFAHIIARGSHQIKKLK